MVQYAKDDGVFEVTAADLDTALAGVLDLRDTPGTSNIDPNAHGSGFDRVSAFQDGFDNGPGKCKDYRDDEPMVLELPFSTEPRTRRAGATRRTTPSSTASPMTSRTTWTQVYPELADGQEWPPLRSIEPYGPGNAPMCGDQSADGYALFYCVPDDYVGWDNVAAMPRGVRPGW